MARDQIFVSYSHRDKRWLDELIISLKPFTRKRNVNVWDDTKINVGARWRDEIEDALKKAKVAVLLVSRYFLHSDFIAESEFPPLLEAAKKEGLVIVWIPIGHSSYEETEIADYQAASEPSRPLNSLSESDVDFELVKIAKAIDRLLDASAADSDAPEPTKPPNCSSTLESKSTDGDSEFDDESAHERIRQALVEGKWAWRTVDVLSAKAALPPEDTIRILRSDPEIELGRGKSGRQIARLKSRIT